ncbi:cell wall hydrolase, partial [Mesorhizobium sp. M7A.F.Ca.ET.027.03.2.1]
MHRRVLKRLVAAAGERRRGFLPPFVIGLGIWIGFPTIVAYQDMT